MITSAEHAALSLIGSGFSQRQAALALGVARSTLRSRVGSGLAKIAAVRAAA